LRTEPLRDLAAVRVEDQPALHRDAEAVRAVNANLGQSGAHFGVRHDARTTPAQGHGRALEDVDLPTALAQVKRA
jgi:hypothetical protein